MEAGARRERTSNLAGIGSDISPLIAASVNAAAAAGQ